MDKDFERLVREAMRRERNGENAQLPLADQRSRVAWEARRRLHLESPEWQALRARLIPARGKKCEQCGNPERLTLHHITYERLGEELDDDLLVLCWSCHDALHKPEPTRAP